MDTRVLRKFLGYLLWGITWLVVLVGIIAGMIYASIVINGTLSLLPVFVGIMFFVGFGSYMMQNACLCSSHIKIINVYLS